MNIQFSELDKAVSNCKFAGIYFEFNFLLIIFNDDGTGSVVHRHVLNAMQAQLKDYLELILQLRSKI
jgi:hypothetical protein